MSLARFSFGIGDRFAHQGLAQLAAFQAAASQHGLTIQPVWNKSHREHTFLHTHPDDVRAEADAAVAALRWIHGHHVDADHIRLTTVDGFLAASDFFTLDVADQIGQPAPTADIETFVAAAALLPAPAVQPGLPAPLALNEATARHTATRYLAAVQEAGRIFRHIATRKPPGTFVTEISMDETDQAQTPEELFYLLALIAREDIPVNTLAPKFTGLFPKGVDYVGDLTAFAREFAADLVLLRHASQHFGLPADLKLSVHSGSDKFSLYPIINRLVHQLHAGLHVKTAGTTWLEEVIGLATSGGEGLALAKEIYTRAHARRDELTAAYASVLDLHPARLPSPDDVATWSSEPFARALTHNQNCPDYHRDFRQLIHVAFKIAGELGPRFTDALKTHAPTIAPLVTHNLLHRHILPLFAPTS